MNKLVWDATTVALRDALAGLAIRSPFRKRLTNCHTAGLGYRVSAVPVRSPESQPMQTTSPSAAST